MPTKKLMAKSLRPLKDWMKLATTMERDALIEGAHTSRDHLYHIANGVRTVSPEIAGRIEAAAKVLRKASKGRLPELTRADLSPVCGECPYAKKCKGKKNDK